jgi:hypothetical protein
MSQKNVKAPRLPTAPVEYDQRFMDQLLNVLRLYFSQLDNTGPLAASTQRLEGDIVAALSFIQPDPAALNTFTISLPTEADLSNLRVGDVYYDTTADNVLKVKV